MNTSNTGAVGSDDLYVKLMGLKARARRLRTEEPFLPEMCAIVREWLPLVESEQRDFAADLQAEMDAMELLYRDAMRVLAKHRFGDSPEIRTVRLVCMKRESFRQAIRAAYRRIERARDFAAPYLGG